jgi:soluble P-type ATPase
VVEGHLLRLGSGAWLERGGVSVPEVSLPPGSPVWLAIDGRCRGVFLLVNPLRPETSRLVQRLAARYELALLSGDNEQERERFQDLFGREAHLRFNQSPLDKLGFIHRLQQAGKVVMMVGDGLNDAGALRQSDVGVAVVEQIGLFSPASDVILEAPQVSRLWEILRFARSAAWVVRVCFGISALYNVVGIGIAAAGVLSPVICAVLMPVSSISVVLFACGAVTWAARRGGLLHHDSSRRQAADPLTRPAGTFSPSEERDGVRGFGSWGVPSSLRTCSRAMNRTRHADFSPPDRGDVERDGTHQARGAVPGSCGLKSAHRFMDSALFHSDLLTGHEPGRDAFHRVPIFCGEVRDAVECVPTGLKGRFMGRFPRRP